MSETLPEGIELRPDDRERMQRLSEEVRGRLLEMALIAARTVGVEMDSDTVAKFAPVRLSSAESGDGSVLQVLERAGFEPNCVCYIDPPGVCQPCQVDPVVIE